MTRVIPESWDGGQVSVRCNAHPGADDRITMKAIERVMGQAIVRLTIDEAIGLVDALNEAIDEVTGAEPTSIADQEPDTNDTPESAPSDLASRITDVDARLRALERRATPSEVTS